jgi:proteasome lid subunit RPN8/RPN11
MEPGTEIALSTWSVRQCAFEIEYSARVLDDIRRAVVDAFFAVPHGGAEIGGILLGNWDGGRVAITGYAPLDCQHALGPSFTLSPRDQAQLTEMIAGARRNPANRQPVGWYHSHTRSEIFLSDADQAIHNRFFPEPWQVALVLKPHTFEPMRAGFFFRERDGSIHAQASRQEFRLEPMPLRGTDSVASNLPAPQRPQYEDSGARATLVETALPPPVQPVPTAEPPKDKRGVPITREIPLETAAPAETVRVDAPGFQQLRPEGSGRVLKAISILAVGLAIGGAGYQTRQYWLPQVIAKSSAVLPKEPDPFLALAVSDDNGQMKIQWDRNAPAVRNAREATLEVADGSAAPQSMRLDNAHLASGVFTYARQAERVDVTLIVAESDGRAVKEQTSFLGRLPAQASTGDDTNAQRAEKLQKDLDVQAAKTRKLEKDLKAMQEQLQKSKQSPDPVKKND